MAFMISNLGGRARAWATAEWGRGSRVCSTLQDFQEGLRRTFDPVAADREKARQLCGLRQGKNTVCDYAILFRTLAAESGWNTTALYHVFLKGLANPVLERLLPLDLPSDLDSLIALAIQTDNRLEEFKALQQERSQTSRLNRSHSTISWTPPTRSLPERGRAAPTQETEEPMQMGRARLSPEERQRRIREGRCFYCGESVHLVAACPAKSTRVGSRATATTPLSSCADPRSGKAPHRHHCYGSTYRLRSRRESAGLGVSKEAGPGDQDSGDTY